MTLRMITVLFCLASGVQSQAEEARYVFAQADRVEYQSDADAAIWDLQGWYGGDLQKIWWKLEGENEPETHNELQLLYSRAVSPYFDAQFGLRVANNDAGSETSLVAGMQGLATYNIEVDAAVFITEHGDFAVRGEFERDFRLTQRLVLQPRVELGVSSTPDDDVALELRLRYEINRKLAPYAGISWQRTFDENVPDDSATSVVAGLRFWF